MGTENKQLVVLTEVVSEVEATTIVAALKEAGIEATMTGNFTAGFLAEAPGYIQVNVFAADAERAKTIWEIFEKENVSIDWDKVDVGDPTDEPG
jgi:ABC-type taurine transport system ATPase subunit